MRYIFNYSYLEKWMQANRDIKDRQVLHAMGTSSNAGLDSWERMKSPIPTIQLLRFCNAFQVPISAFIVDMEADYNEGIEQLDYVQADINDQFEPDGGYIPQDEKRPLGTRALRDPADVDIIKSVVPGLTTIKTSHQDIQTGGIRQTATATHASIRQSATTSPSPAPDKKQAAATGEESAVGISTLNKMLDIIAEQQKQMAEQQKLIAEQQREIAALTHRLLDNDNERYQIRGIGTAADPIHRDE